MSKRAPGKRKTNRSTHITPATPLKNKTLLEIRQSSKALAKRRVEDCYEWPFSIPREIMDIILADPTLGVREHLMLAATHPALRRLYHNKEVFDAVLHCRTAPFHGTQVSIRTSLHVPPEKVPALECRLATIATAPHKVHGAFFIPLSSRYPSHDDALEKALLHRISAIEARRLYPNVTNRHLVRLPFYPSQRTSGRHGTEYTREGYPEVMVEWISLRVASGLAF